MHKTRLIVSIVTLALLLTFVFAFAAPALAETQQDDPMTSVEGVWVSTDEKNTKGTLIISGDGTYVYSSAYRDLRTAKGYTFIYYGTLHYVNTAFVDSFLFIGDCRTDTAIEGVNLTYDPGTDTVYFHGRTFAHES